MQIFMRGIPPECRKEDLEVILARYLHRPPFPSHPTNFHIRFFRSNGRSINGLLTLPSSDIGERFLHAYGQNGIPVSNSRVRFSPNRLADDAALVAQIGSTEWVDPEILRGEAERVKKDSSEIELEGFCFGRLCRDRTFSVEVPIQGEATVACDMENRRIRLTLTPQRTARVPQNSDLFESFMTDLLNNMTISNKTYAWYRAPQILALCYSDSTSGPHHVLIEANAPPVFEKPLGLSIFSDRESSQRQESIYGSAPMASLGRLVCLTFQDRDSLDTFVQRCRRLHIRRTSAMFIPVVSHGLDNEFLQRRCDELLYELPFPLAFEADKALSGGVLARTDLISLHTQLLELHRTKGSGAEAIFRWFIANVPAPSLRTMNSLSLKDIQAEFTKVFTQKKKRKRRNRGVAARQRLEHQVSQMSFDDPTLSDLLRLAVAVYAPEQPRSTRLITPTAAIYQSYHMILTPTSRILEGPLPDQSSTILRRFGNNDNFLRITFQDDNRVTLRQDMTLNISIKELLKSRYRRAMMEGLYVAGRRFEFLGYSMSGLKQHSVFFVCPFEFDLPGVGKTLMTAERIRSNLGDFSRILTKPALLAARWAQVFSATSPSITLQPSQVRKIEDRKSPSGSVFTDGCSPASSDICRAAAGKVRSRKSGISRLTPSGFQFRCGGAKGVFFEDHTLPPMTLTLRPSQLKFESTTALTLDIASHSGRPIRMFLNRPLIMVLEHLGVPDDSFFKLQNDAIHNVEQIRSSFLESSKLFQQHGLGTSFRLPSLFNNMVKELKLNDDDVAQNILQCDLITTSLAFAATHVLREIKFRARIPVPGSYTLIGISDEWGCLREGEVYATIRDERNGILEKIQGKVLITRSPQIHPGDVQFVNAVRRPELEHLNNVVVFSCEGNRSLPSCLGGGDLDGDIFNLIVNTTLFPSRTVEPGSYIGLPHKETAGPCQVSDIVDFVIDYLEADVVGMISSRHMCIADLADDGPACDPCLKLAEYASHAVDFPKTGTPVDFSKLPKSSSRLKPDFLSTETTEVTAGGSFYPSRKVLGILFRRVPLHDDQEDYVIPGFGSVILNALTRLDRTARGFGLPSIFGASETLMQEMGDLFDNYKDELTHVAKAHTMSKHPNEQLSEAELLSGTIQAKWADHRKRRETVASMNLQTQLLTKATRKELRRVDLTTNVAAATEYGTVEEEDEEDEEDEDILSNKDVESFARASAAWAVACEEFAEGSFKFGSGSFGLIALGVLLEVVKKARRIMHY